MNSHAERAQPADADVATIADAHAQPGDVVLAALAVTSAAGLDPAEISERQLRYGRNQLAQARRRSAWLILADQFRSIIVWLLAGAAGLSFSLADWADGLAILIVLAINTAIGFFTELRASRSMEALRQMSITLATVRRGSGITTIPAEELVSGDIVLLDAGDVVGADLRLIEVANLQCDESALTGESVAVRKGVLPVDGDAPLAERTSMVFKGSAITTGAGTGVVVATGMATELGRISALLQKAEPERSPLEERLDRLGRHLVQAALGLSLLTGAMGVWQGQEILVMLQTAIALAVAAVPEGLPIVATLALARGLWRMAARNVVIERLSAVETLGATTLILTDKTGTLTENRMTVIRLALTDGDIELAPAADESGARFIRETEPGNPACDPLIFAALRVCALCNNAVVAADGIERDIGDPTEVALLRAAAQGGLAQIRQELPRARQEPFSSETLVMGTLHRRAENWLVAAKGAPEALLGRASHVLTRKGVQTLDDAGRTAWLARNAALAERGFRVLALAQRETDEEPTELCRDVTMVGLVAMIDPPRPDVAAAIASCRRAGVRVIMLTGDHIATATTVAKAVGLGEQGPIISIEARDFVDPSRLAPNERKQLLQATVFARISPEAKLGIVALHQANGAVVAMTGDGVNDAPALKKADIGVAMGRRGTQVAREAADMVLRDDAFASIVAAMREGRVIYANIRKFVSYLLSCNLSEIMVIGAATLVGLPLPLLPLQILFLNLVTDVFPALALGAGNGDADVLERPPHDPGESIIDRSRWLAIIGHAGLITAATLAAFVTGMMWLGLGQEESVTVSFLTLALSQLWHVFNMREPGSRLLRNEITWNPYVWGALGLCLGLVLAALYVPVFANVLGLTAPGIHGWLLAGTASAGPLAIGQVVKALPRRRS